MRGKLKQVECSPKNNSPFNYDINSLNSVSTVDTEGEIFTDTTCPESGESGVSFATEINSNEMEILNEILPYTTCSSDGMLALIDQLTQLYELQYPREFYDKIPEKEQKFMV